MWYKLLHGLARLLVMAYTGVMLDLDVLWQSPLPDGPHIIVANHPSFTDPFFVAMLSSKPVSILIIASAFLVPVFGFFLRRAGHIPVTPGRGRDAFEQARRALEKGRSVLIFPEGDASPREGGFRPPRTGAARLALLTGAPVVPVGIHLARERLRTIESRITGASTVGYWYLRGPYHMTVGEPMHFVGDVEDRERVVSASERIMQCIIALTRESERRMKAYLSRSKSQARTVSRDEPDRA